MIWRTSHSIFILCVLALNLVRASIKYNQRTFLAVKAVHLIDPTKNGFRILLKDEFLKEHLSPTLLPTLYVSAIPLKADEDTVNKVFYPDNLNEDKQVTLEGLNERAWYYLCVEWENFNRHNETTGTDCRIHRTLDRFGKSAESTLDDIGAADISAQMFVFKVRSSADFPLRLTAFLQGGEMSSPPAQVFQVTKPTEVEVVFPFLKQDRDYGRLCFMEEPLVTGFTAMGRQISGLTITRCYFKNLKTKDYELSISVSEASPYVRNSAASTTTSTLIALILLLLVRS
ncbi:unnamed protein product [Bursaphelenchus okinawaensis]|uniref:Uncharacterized protein n=1 Tax=Bursaphelenchus okinawaensis TaxID=465554 RepID=A0A811LNY6_9BILA|nr:unnamed protein product [Bursaphelenchus okinawaensis]CAG9126506.1 unnamed protein product [Bursaphelenchus okinawaensis]